MFVLLHRANGGEWWVGGGGGGGGVRDSTVTSMHTKRSFLENNQTEIALVKQTKVTSLLVLRKYESSTGKYD